MVPQGHVVRLAFCVVLLLIALVALSFSAAWGKEVHKGEGQRISLVTNYWPDPPPCIEISSSLPSWVGHGFSDARYPGSIPDGMAAGDGITNSGGSYFEFRVNGVQVDLTFLTSVAQGKAPGASTKVVNWFVQFPAGYFEPNTTYEITGVWGSRNPNNANSEKTVLITDLIVWP
jgi:hypothetical protein